ncbi:MAG: hypothetical protein EOO09_16950 [Chitinophagaceae bacterium]|nr:MAG: hypothetical protein EOO09_16950 [Chitinophagaceae bacterium]
MNHNTPGRAVKLFRAASLLLISAMVFSCKKDNSPGPCETVTVMGKLTRRCDSVYEFRTSGGGSIEIDMYKGQVIVRHADYSALSIEFWGGLINGNTKTNNFLHENLRGKHVKDKLLPTRTLIFPDGAKITMVATSMDTEAQTISIYDGNESHQFDFAAKTVKHSSLDGAKARQLDAAEADGETASFSIDSDGVEFYNIYHEVTPGNKIDGRVMIGSLDRTRETQVNDYFDDPRLSHT